MLIFVLLDLITRITFEFCQVNQSFTREMRITNWTTLLSIVNQDQVLFSLTNLKVKIYTVLFGYNEIQGTFKICSLWPIIAKS